MDQVRVAVRKWLEVWIVGQGLCPFASAPLRAGQVRIAVSGAQDMEGVLTDVLREVERLLAPPDGVRTTLVVFPDALSGWDAFLDAVGAAELILEASELDAEVQLVGFHPEFRFEDSTGPADRGDRVNQSPVPLVHLLSVADVAEAVAAHPDAEGIAERNAARLRAGDPAVEAAWEELRQVMVDR